ncbi:hypothetical protein [Actinocorallia populi]|uniref:hypothetical protein n=1 Tax=Actinocorallia populi TaxID=2079200 RepID=UPI000D0911A1|nr:hypothetical protein [Actinocorallia populi]
MGLARTPAGPLCAALALTALTGCGVITYPEPPEPHRPASAPGERRILEPEKAGGLIKVPELGLPDHIDLGPARLAGRTLAGYYRLPSVDVEDGPGRFSLVIAAETGSDLAESRRDHFLKEVLGEDSFGLYGQTGQDTPGPLGGTSFCGWTATPEDGGMACAWSDEDTAGVITFPSGGTSEKDLEKIIRTFVAMRHDIER